MHHQRRTPHDPKLQAHIEKTDKHDHRIEHIFRRILHWIERFIAVVTILVMMAAMGVEIYRMFTQPGYMSDVSNYLHHALTIVVGLEFVRMLIDTTPANILEALTVAITRQVILTHDNPWSNLASVACIAALFATRRFLVHRNELKKEMVEMD